MTDSTPAPDFQRAREALKTMIWGTTPPVGAENAVYFCLARAEALLREQEQEIAWLQAELAGMRQLLEMARLTGPCPTCGFLHCGCSPENDFPSRGPSPAAHQHQEGSRGTV